MDGSCDEAVGLARARAGPQTNENTGFRENCKDAMSNPIYFKPIYQERVWGGRNLEEALGRKLPEGEVIGESWDVVDRPEAMSFIEKGDFAGKSLRELIEDRPEEIMGEGYDSSRPFPILVKWLDCSDRLSLQVHPPAEVAPALGGEPKTENWYIADCQADASLIVGLKNGVTRDEFERRLGEGTLEECVHRFPVSSGAVSYTHLTLPTNREV